MERTLILLKPDTFQRRLVGQILSRFENKGLNIVAMKLIQVTPELSKQHYAEHAEKPFYPSLEDFITSAPVVALALEGLDAISVVRDTTVTGERWFAITGSSSHSRTESGGLTPSAATECDSDRSSRRQRSSSMRALQKSAPPAYTLRINSQRRHGSRPRTSRVQDQV